MAASSNKNKPKLTHIHHGYTENGKYIKEHRIAVKTADSIFNSPSTAKPAFENKPRKRK